MSDNLLGALIDLATIALVLISKLQFVIIRV